MQDTVNRTPTEAQAARARRCALCEAPPGVPCQAKPEADHLARFLDAYVAGKLSRACRRPWSASWSSSTAPS